MTNQEDAVINTSRQFFLIMGHHNHGLVLSLAERLDDIFHQPTIHIVKTMKWLIKDKKFRILHECTSQQDQTLLTAGEFEKTCFFLSFQSKDLHPETADIQILILRFDIKSY